MSVKAVILAAGKGKRLGVLGITHPKCMLPLATKIILDHQCDSLLAAGVEDIIIVGGYKIDEIRDYLQGKFTVIENTDYETTNSIYSLWLAREKIGDDGFIVCNGDVLYDATLIRRFIMHPAKNACLIDETKSFNHNEYHAVVKNGMVVCYSNQVRQDDSSGESAQMFKIGKNDAGIFMNRLKELIHERGKDQYASVPLDILIEQRRLEAVFTKGEIWLEIDSMEDYLKALRIFRSNNKCRKTADAGKSKPELSLKRFYRFISWSISRTIYYARKKELPGDIRSFLTGFIKHPVKSLALLPGLLTRRLSIYGYNLQIYGAGLLKQVMKECDAQGLTLFLTWGTLLGCVRERAFIMNDHDIDVGLLADDFAKRELLKKALVAKGFKLRIDDAYKLSLLHPDVENLFVDIDLVYEKNGHMVISNMQTNDGCLYSYYFKKDIFAKFKTMTFVGVDVRVPEGAKDFLESVYGDWRAPREKSHYLYGPLNLIIESR